MKALHAEAHPGSWRECRGDVHLAFHEKTSESSSSVLPQVLSKIPVLIFAGDQDLICNYIGLENMIRALTWNGATGLGVSRLLLEAERVLIISTWQTVQTQSWSVNAAPAGTWVTSRNLTYVKVSTPDNCNLYLLTRYTTDLQCFSYGTMGRPSCHTRHDASLYGHELLGSC